MLGYFKNFINLYFFKAEYEVTPIKSVDIKQMKSDWYFIKNLFNDENQDNQETENNNMEVE
jgi:hypothetical protein